MQADIREYNNQQSPADKAICEALAEAIQNHLPEAEGKVWHGAPVWFLDGNPVTGYSKQKAGIQLLFWSGQSFEEPALQSEGKFKAAGIRFNDVTAIDQEALQGWLQMSKDIQWDYKNLVKRKGILERLK